MKAAMIPDGLLFTGGVARIMGVSGQTVRDWANDGRLAPVYRTKSGVRLFTQDAVDRLVLKRKAAGVTRDGRFKWK